MRVFCCLILDSLLLMVGIIKLLCICWNKFFGNLIWIRGVRIFDLLKFLLFMDVMLRCFLICGMMVSRFGIWSSVRLILYMLFIVRWSVKGKKSCIDLLLRYVRMILIVLWWLSFFILYMMVMELCLFMFMVWGIIGICGLCYYMLIMMRLISVLVVLLWLFLIVFRFGMLFFFDVCIICWLNWLVGIIMV